MKLHPRLQGIFPLLNEESYTNLKDDIKKNGILDPIKYFEDTEGDEWVLDGHNRLKISKELEITDIPSKKLGIETLDEAEFWIRNNQSSRRQLNKKQDSINKAKLEQLSLKLGFQVYFNNSSYNKQVAKAVEKIEEVIGERVVDQLIKDGDVSRKHIIKISQKSDDEIVDELHALKTGKATSYKQSLLFCKRAKVDKLTDKELTFIDNYANGGESLESYLKAWKPVHKSVASNLLQRPIVMRAILDKWKEGTDVPYFKTIVQKAKNFEDNHKIAVFDAYRDHVENANMGDNFRCCQILVDLHRFFEIWDRTTFKAKVKEELNYHHNQLSKQANTLGGQYEQQLKQIDQKVLSINEI